MKKRFLTGLHTSNRQTPLRCPSLISHRSQDPTENRLEQSLVCLRHDLKNGVSLMRANYQFEREKFDAPIIETYCRNLLWEQRQ